MRNCNNHKLTNKALTYLKSIEVLDVGYCKWITMFQPPESLKRLTMECCHNISDQTFAYFGNIKYLDIRGCNQTSITDKAFVHLKDIKTLVINGCNQTTITDKAFENLRNIEELYMVECTQDTLTDKIYTYLKNIKIINTNGSKIKPIEDSIIRNKREICKAKTLKGVQCKKYTINESEYCKIHNKKSNI